MIPPCRLVFWDTVFTTEISIESSMGMTTVVMCVAEKITLLKAVNLYMDAQEKIKPVKSMD